MLEIYSVLCTSHCVINVPPLMGQVLGKVLLTSWEINKLLMVVSEQVVY